MKRSNYHIGATKNIFLNHYFNQELDVITSINGNSVDKATETDIMKMISDADNSLELTIKR